MTAITSNNMTTPKNHSTQPLKVALAGLTMIQQSLLEFYFETQEGKKQYIQVLGKDADAYITSFDENGSTDAWENLYAHEKKPTLVLSHQHKVINNYIYIPKPITPIALSNAATSLNNLVTDELLSPQSSASLQFSIDSQKNDTIDTPLSVNKEGMPTLLVTTTDNSENKKEELDELLSFEKQKIPTKQERFSELEMLDDLNLAEEESSVIPSFEETINIEETSTIAIPEIKVLPEKKETEEKTIQVVDSFEEVELNNISPPDDLEALLSELTEEDSKQKEQSSIAEKPATNQNSVEKQKTKEEKRWNVLCGEHDDISYKISKPEEIYFKPTETLLPYLKDTIDFSKRNNCWMEVSYKYLSIIIDPETSSIHCNISLEDKNFIYLCVKEIDEDQIELEEIDEQGITQFKQSSSNKTHYDYSFESFVWTTSLIVSHGRLPDSINPDNRISINNWLSLKEVEKFPHIMQIAAIFDQHHASLNEVATWMSLPKRYVYSFYNGVEALNMIEQDSDKLNKKSLITMMKDEKESTLKKILFTKIM